MPLVLVVDTFKADKDASKRANAAAVYSYNYRY
jgi:hypothetical protein